MKPCIFTIGIRNIFEHQSEWNICGSRVIRSRSLICFLKWISWILGHHFQLEGDEKTRLKDEDGWIIEGNKFRELLADEYIQGDENTVMILGAETIWIFSRGRKKCYRSLKWKTENRERVNDELIEQVTRQQLSINGYGAEKLNTLLIDLRSELATTEKVFFEDDFDWITRRLTLAHLSDGEWGKILKALVIENLDQTYPLMLNRIGIIIRFLLVIVLIMGIARAIGQGSTPSESLTYQNEFSKNIELSSSHWEQLLENGQQWNHRIEAIELHLEHWNLIEQYFNKVMADLLLLKSEYELDSDGSLSIRIITKFQLNDGVEGQGIEEIWKHFKAEYEGEITLNAVESVQDSKYEITIRSNIES